MKNNWLQLGSTFTIQDAGTQVSPLPLGVYRLQYNEDKDLLYLVQVKEKFDFPYKIYGAERPFIDRVLKTYRSTKGNLGILMNGIKGTGKTVTAELICNELKLPVIMVNRYFKGTPNFINSLQQDTIILFDEFEKVYDKDTDEEAHSILTVMDGVLSNEYRKVFILTTNYLWIDENLLQRPGRIRYLKKFTDLPLSAIEEILDDMLERPELRESILEFLSELEIITIDIVKAVISECNIHAEPPQNFKEVFNVKTTKDHFDLYLIRDDGDRSLIAQDVDMLPKRITAAWIGREIKAGGRSLGRLHKVTDELNFVVSVNGEYDKKGSVQKYRYQLVEKAEKHAVFFNHSIKDLV